MRSKTVYQYDDNGYFLFVTEADESPLEPGTFLFPRNTTEIPVPNFDSNKQIARFTNSNWTIEEIDKHNDAVDKIIEFLKNNPDVYDYISHMIDDKYINKQGHPRELSSR